MVRYFLVTDRILMNILVCISVTVFLIWDRLCSLLSLSLSLSRERNRKREIERELGYTSKKIHSHLQRLSFHLSCWIVEKILYNLISNVSTWFSFILKLIWKYPTSFTVASWYCKTRIKPLTKWNDGITLSLKYFSRYSNKISLYVPSQCTVTIV